MCADTHDDDSWHLLMAKINKSGSYINQETLNLLLSHEDSCNGYLFLSKLLVIDSEFNNKAQQKLPIIGQIREPYLFSEERLVNPEMVDELVDVNKELEDRYKICFKTMQVMINPVLGSKDTLEYLDVMANAPSENLMLTQCAVFVEVLWKEHKTFIYLLTQVPFLQFIIFMWYIVFHLESFGFTVFVHALSTLLILLELREVLLNSCSYFSSVWNWLDLFGNISVIVHCILFEMHGKEIIQQGAVK